MINEDFDHTPMLTKGKYTYCGVIYKSGGGKQTIKLKLLYRTLLVKNMLKLYSIYLESMLIES